VYQLNLVSAGAAALTDAWKIPTRCLPAHTLAATVAVPT
jgi:hypothetical protein